MQRRRCTEVEIGITVSPPDSICTSFVIDRTASNCLDVGENYTKLENLSKQVYTMLTLQNTSLEHLNLSSKEY